MSTTKSIRITNPACAEVAGRYKSILKKMSRLRSGSRHEKIHNEAAAIVLQIATMVSRSQSWPNDALRADAVAEAAEELARQLPNDRKLKALAKRSRDEMVLRYIVGSIGSRVQSRGVDLMRKQQAYQRALLNYADMLRVHESAVDLPAVESIKQALDDPSRLPGLRIDDRLALKGFIASGPSARKAASATGIGRGKMLRSIKRSRSIIRQEFDLM